MSLWNSSVRIMIFRGFFFNGPLFNESLTIKYLKPRFTNKLTNARQIRLIFQNWPSWLKKSLIFVFGSPFMLRFERHQPTEGGYDGAYCSMLQARHVRRTRQDRGYAAWHDIWDCKFAAKNRGKRHFVKKGLSKVFVDVNFWNLFLSERSKYEIKNFTRSRGFPRKRCGPREFLLHNRGAT